MYSDNSKPICFDQFSFDADRFALYFCGDLIKSAEKKQLEVLLTFLRRPNELVTYDEIIENVWPDNLYGATSTRVNQYVSRLQKIFHEYVPEKNYFENVKGRGYIFRVALDEPEAIAGAATPASPPESRSFQPLETQRSFRLGKAAAIVFSVVAIVFIAGAFWFYSGSSDDSAIRNVVRESQLYESLVLYENPKAFNETDLDKYWTKEVDSNINYDRGRIRDSVKKMIAEGRRYGAESKCEQFDFQSVEIDVSGKTAVVKTLEKWFVSTYANDGTLLKNRTIGPYFVSYILKKIDGRWLIEKSTTGRVIRPVPQISTIEPTTEARSGQQFLVTLTGQDFESETIAIEVTGVGCPDLKPCRVPNSVLREHADMSHSTIRNIPLTLASGEFKIVARNGDSTPSEPVFLNVP